MDCSNAKSNYSKASISVVLYGKLRKAAKNSLHEQKIVFWNKQLKKAT